MIIPTPEFDPFYADDGMPFRDKMLARIEREFGDLLGRRRGLLRSDHGLETLGRLVSEQLAHDAKARGHAA